MKISTNTIRFINEHYGSAGNPAANGIDDLVERIGAQLGAVEEVSPFGDKFEGVLIVKVVGCEDHPNADKLHVCKIDDGGTAQNVERDENGYVQVVCGATNVREGLIVAWLPPGSTVPETFYDPESFVLEVRELRGIKSNGMLASPKELSLGDSHAGILEIDGDIAPGTTLVEAYNLKDDAVIDMENKMFTHRPDCFGWLGIAREIEGVYQRPYKSPEWYQIDPETPGIEGDELKLEVRNEIPELVPRFTAITMRDVKIGASPVWLQVELAKVGLRPINNIVDYTNLFMLKTGQPLHAYDYDKVVAQDSNADHATIVVRHPRSGEKIRLLNGKEIEPRIEAIMIATNDKLIGVGGVMGGGDTEVDEDTKNIIIECANFDMYSIRRTSMAHGLFTDAVTRFNKGQSPLQNLAVLAKIIAEIRESAGGKVAGALVDDNHLPAEMLQRGSIHPSVVVSRDFINERLGLQLLAHEMAALLTNVEFKVEIENDQLTITAPFWRTDIEISEDIVEEIGRLYGYDKLPLVLPKRDITPVKKDASLELKSQIRTALSKAGANEVLTYSFVHGDLIDKVGQDRTQAFQLSNALSPDLQYYRLSLTPSLLEKVHANVKSGYDEFALFEFGKVHLQGKADRSEPEIPQELNTLSLVFTAESKHAQQTYAGAPYYAARHYLVSLLTAFGVATATKFESLAAADISNNAWLQQITAPFEPSRSAVVSDQKGIIWGVVGEFKSSVRKALKLPDYTAGFEVGPLLFTQVASHMNYTALPRFPKVEQDICLRVTADLSYQELFDFVQQTIEAGKPEKTIAHLSPLDIYQREDDVAHKQITFRLGIASYEKTLTDAEVSVLLAKLAQAAGETFKAERI